MAAVACTSFHNVQSIHEQPTVTMAMAHNDINRKDVSMKLAQLNADFKLIQQSHTQCEYIDVTADRHTQWLCYNSEDKALAVPNSPVSLFLAK